jgi:hypothetical protein
MPLSLEEPGADDYDNETFPSTLVSIIITYSFSFFLLSRFLHHQMVEQARIY